MEIKPSAGLLLVELQLIAVPSPAGTVLREGGGWLWVPLVALGRLVTAAEGFGREAAERPSLKHVHAQGSAQRCRHCPQCVWHPFASSAFSPTQTVSQRVNSVNQFVREVSKDLLRLHKTRCTLS